MEFANGVALRSPSRYYYYQGAGINPQYRKSCSSSISSAAFNWGSRKSLSCRKLRAKPSIFGNFEEKSDLGYYDRNVVCGDGNRKLMNNKKEKKESWNGMPTKKKLKLLKGLTKDLSTFSQVGFGMDISEQGLSVHEDKARIIAEAAEVLLAQLKQLRAQQEDLLLNRKKKEEKAMLDCESSSSSESSDSESDCDEEEVVDMSNLRNQAAATATAYVRNLEVAVASLPNKSSSSVLAVESQALTALSLDQNCCSNGGTTRYGGSSSLVNLETSSSGAAENNSSISSVDAATKSESLILGRKRIEVCMGGKCEKSGGPALMEEFQKVLGFEGAVVGCKCLGKCKHAPNVRVVNCSDTAETVNSDDSVRVPSNPLYLGVTREDVGWILASYFL